MKIKALFIFTFLISNCIISQNLSMLDKKNGFRNIKLNSNIKNMSDFQKMDEELDFEGIWYGLSQIKYVLKNRYENKMTINESKIRNIELSTIDSKIFKIHILVEFNESLPDYMTLVYGKPTNSYKKSESNSSYDYSYIYEWETEKIKCTIKNSYLKNNSNSQISYLQKSLWNQYLEKAKQKEKKGKKTKQKKAISEF